MISPTSSSTIVSTRDYAKIYKNPSPVTIKDFELLNLVGRGSFGKVMLAREMKSDRIFAIKVSDYPKRYRYKIKQSSSRAAGSAMPVPSRRSL